MGACNFGGSVIGCVAVGMVGADGWTEEDRADYREMMGDDGLTDDYVDNCLWDNENDYIDEVRELSEQFAEDLQNFIYYRFFEQLHTKEMPLKISLDDGYHSGFVMRVKATNVFYCEQAKNWSKYYLINKDHTPEAWYKHVEKAIDFADYALARFAYSKGLLFITDGYAGEESRIDVVDVRDFARFEKYGSELARLWWAFYRISGKEYNQSGF